MTHKTVISICLTLLLIIAPWSAWSQDTLAVISLNDFHGSFVKSKDVPGAGNVYTAINKLKERYPSNIVVSAGDNFGGSYFSVLNQGALLPFFFSKLGIAYSAIGNHEFDNGQEFLSRLGKDTIKYVCANIFNEKGELLPYASGSVTAEINLPENLKKKIGIIGLISAGAKSQTGKKNVEGLDFKSAYKDIINNESGKLDTDFKILLAHIGTSTDKSGKAQWDNAELKDSLKNLPNEIIGIASGHSHKYVCGDIEGIPTVQGEISGKYISVLRFVYSRQDNSIKPISPLAVKVEDTPDGSSGRLEIDAAIDSICRTTMVKSIGMALNENIGFAKNAILHNRNKNPREQTMLGTYVCMSYAESYRRKKKLNSESPVVAFCHFGCIRRSLEPGELNVLTAGELLPFSNNLKIYQLTGKEIFKIIEEGIRNKKGCIQMNNLVADTICHNGQTRVINVAYKTSGKEYVALSKTRSYPVIVDEYITTGGDGYPENLFPQEKQEKGTTLEGTTDSFLIFLKTLQKKGEQLDANSPDKATLKAAILW